MIKWLSIRFGYRFWYQVKFEYRINGVLKLDWVDTIGLTSKSTILNSRVCKKIEGPLHLNKWLKPHLKNGTINMVVISYLGYLIR